MSKHNINSNGFSPISEIIHDARLGKMFILVDDEARENEGDFIVAAEYITVKQMADMINYGSGIVCLVIDEERRKQLDLNLQTRRGRAAIEANQYLASLDSIEAAEGITTGISAYDRVQTIKAAIASNALPDSIITPGHIFPLLAHKGGVLARGGHTEASMEIMKLAGLSPYAALCEVNMKNGTMALLPNLIRIAKKLKIKIGSIKDLCEFLKK